MKTKIIKKKKAKSKQIKKHKKIFKKKELDFFLKKLEDEKERLKKQFKEIEKEKLQSTSIRLPSEPTSYDDDSTDTASEVSEIEKITALENNINKLILKIDSAIEKIKKGTYGICDLCGKTIDKARLKIIPYATLCIKCKAHQEKLKK